MSFRKGDKVVYYNKTFNSAYFTNGKTYTIEKVDGRKGLVTVREDHGNLLELKPTHFIKASKCTKPYEEQCNSCRSGGGCSKKCH